MWSIDQFLTDVNKANVAYSQKLQLDRQKEKELIVLSWKVKELSDLNVTGRCSHSEITQLNSSKQQGDCKWREYNVPKHLSNIWQRMVAFITGVTRHKCIPASHILVLMISSEAVTREAKSHMLSLFNVYRTRAI